MKLASYGCQPAKNKMQANFQHHGVLNRSADFLGLWPHFPSPGYFSALQICFSKKGTFVCLERNILTRKNMPPVSVIKCLLCRFLTWSEQVTAFGMVNHESSCFNSILSHRKLQEKCWLAFSKWTASVTLYYRAGSQTVLKSVMSSGFKGN